MTLFSGMLIWALVIQHEYLHHPPGKLDWTSKGFGRGFGLCALLRPVRLPVFHILTSSCPSYRHHDQYCWKPSSELPCLLSLYILIVFIWQSADKFDDVGSVLEHGFTGRWYIRANALCWPLAWCRIPWAVRIVWH